jgi:hypothetical protein
MASISASGQDAITRTIDVEADRTANGSQFEDFYETERTLGEIVRGNYERVRYESA